MEAINPLLADQWGMVTTGQAEAAGVSRVTIKRMADAGELVQLRRGVYMSPQFPMTDLDPMRAAWLAADASRTRADRYDDVDQVIVAEESAARLHGIGDLPVAEIRFNSRRRIRVDGAATSSEPIVRAEWDWLDGLPVTSPRRTIEDLVRSGRWNDDHVRSVIDDAMDKGILKPADAARSRLILRVAPHLAPPASHQSVAQLLRNDAKARGVAANDAIAEFTRMLFLASLMERTDDWVVKGGTGMLCRFGKVRSTKDLDLFRVGVGDNDSPARSAQYLVHVMNGVTVGAYTFGCASPPSSSGEDRDSHRVMVTVASRGARPVATFSVDVSAKVHLSKDPDMAMAERSDRADIPGYPRRFPVRLYPLENQMADKICAMYEVHNGRASTRYRDLYDLAVMADRGVIDAPSLIDAVREQQVRRSLSVPRPLMPPSPTWPSEYDRAVRKMARPGRPQYATYEAAVRLVEARLGAALDMVGASPTAQGSTSPTVE